MWFKPIMQHNTTQHNTTLYYTLPQDNQVRSHRLQDIGPGPLGSDGCICIEGMRSLCRPMGTGGWDRGKYRSGRGGGIGVSIGGVGEGG